MKALFLILFSFILFSQTQSQNIYFSESASVTFSSTTIFETFHAKNDEVPSLLDIQTGRITFSALIQAFDFKNRLMKKQFNEYFIDSEEYPRADFKGNIINIGDIDFLDKTPQEIDIEGRIFINGIKKDILIQGIIYPSEKIINANSTFILNPSDFDIKIPQPLAHKIAENIYVTVDVSYEPYHE